MKAVKFISVVMVTIGVIVLFTGIYFAGEASNWGEAEVKGLHTKTNEERIAKGLKPLVLNESLIKSATDKCQDMKNRNYFDHKSPDGQEPWVFIEKYMKYKEAGENLAQSTGSSVNTVNSWMDSPTHKENILKASYTDVGYGICGSYVVQHFIAK